VAPDYYNRAVRRHEGRLMRRRGSVAARLFRSLSPASLREAALRAFMPVNYPHSVPADYWDFTKWQFVQGTCSSMSGVLATQAMLLSVGVSPHSAAGSAAAINWVLKDGLGMVGRIFVGAAISDKFDTQPKRWRLFGDALYNVGVFLEMCTMLSPPHFLLLASAANSVKGVALMAGAATRASIHRGFAIRENLGDITAKADSQNVARSLVGMAMGVAVSPWLAGDFMGTLSAFAGLSCIHMFANYKSVRAVHVATMSSTRVLQLAEQFVLADTELGKLLPRFDNVASVTKISKTESVLSDGEWTSLTGAALERAPTISVAVALPIVAPTEPAFVALCDFFKKERYMLQLIPDDALAAMLPQWQAAFPSSAALAQGEPQ
jgi:hypothetical protein